MGKPSIEAVTLAGDCQQVFMANPRNPATWSPKVAALIQSALDQERAKAWEEVERFIDRGDWCGRDELAEGIRALASNQGKAE